MNEDKSVRCNALLGRGWLWLVLCATAVSANPIHKSLESPPAVQALNGINQLQHIPDHLADIGLSKLPWLFYSKIMSRNEGLSVMIPFHPLNSKVHGNLGPMNSFLVGAIQEVNYHGSDKGNASADDSAGHVQGHEGGDVYSLLVGAMGGLLLASLLLYLWEELGVGWVALKQDQRRSGSDVRCIAGLGGGAQGSISPSSGNGGAERPERSEGASGIDSTSGRREK